MGQKEKYKIVVIGESGGGKTSVIRRLTNGDFLENSQTTMGIDFQIKKVQMKDYSIVMQIWDTAGQERFKSLITSYIRGSDIICIVYDITSRASFDQVDMWIDEVRKGQKTMPKLWLIGNKIDMKSESQVTKNEAYQKASEFEMQTIMTSAKTGENIEKLEKNMAEYLYNKSQEDDKHRKKSDGKKRKRKQKVKLESEENNNTTSGCC